VGVQVPPSAPFLEIVMIKLALITFFVFCTLMMSYFLIHTGVGHFETQSNHAKFIIYTALILLAYKITYFLFDLTHAIMTE
jgi:hypothetical protein